ncbi:myosin head (motor domain) domain-containing protein, partial [Cardiosporidium cionae]
VYKDIRNIYPTTWSYPIYNLLRRIDSELGSSTAVAIIQQRQIAPVKVEILAIGGHHSIIILKKKIMNPKDSLVDDTQKGKNIRKVFKDANHVYSWGWNDKGQLGDSSISPQKACSEMKQHLKFYVKEFSNVPLQVGYTDYTYSIRWVGAGDDHCMALSESGCVFTWGDNGMGQCGQGHRRVKIPEPAVIQKLKEHNEIAASGSVGRQHATIVTIEGNCYIWGANAYVNLRHFPEESHIYVPTKVSGVGRHRIIQASCGPGFNVLRVNFANGVFLWGRNDKGQLGLGDEERASRDYLTFLPIEKSPSTCCVEKISLGSDCVVACLRGALNPLFIWGAVTIFEPASESAPTGKSSSLPVRENPFLKKAMRKREPVRSSHEKVPANIVSSLLKKRSIRHPVPMKHSLWDGQVFKDVLCVPDRTMVLTDNGFVFGVHFFQVIRATTGQETSQTSHFATSSTYGNDIKMAAENERDEVVPTLHGSYYLEPALFCIRKLRPTYMQVMSLQSAYNPISCAVTMATHQKRSGRKAENDEQPIQQTQHISCTGDSFAYSMKLKVKKKVIDAYQTSQELREPLMKDYLQIPRFQDDDTYTPDPLLLRNMKM